MGDKHIHMPDENIHMPDENIHMPDENVGSMVTYGQEYTYEIDYTYPILFTMDFDDKLRHLITEIDYEFMPHVRCIYPKEYVLLRGSDEIHGLFIFDDGASTWTGP